MTKNILKKITRLESERKYLIKHIKKIESRIIKITEEINDIYKNL